MRPAGAVPVVLNLQAPDWRIRREETILGATDAGYRAYQMRVRWRLLPFVY